MSLPEVYIVSAARTAVGNFQGAFQTLAAHDLGAIVIKEVLNRANVAPDAVDEVILGQVLTAAQGQNPARQASIKAGIPKEVPAYGVNMLCGSGLKPVGLGFQAIRNGDSNLIVCGGQESMTKAPHAMNLRNPTKMGSATMVDTMITDGLTDAFYNIHMGITAENLAKQYNITREEQDKFATRSQNLAETAQNNGYFDQEIVGVPVQNRKETITVTKDEFIKPGTKLEILAKLRPCFITDGSGTVTAANASGINDSAAAVLLASQQEVTNRNLKPLAKIIAFSQTGCCPKVMGAGPVGAVQSVLKKAGWTKDEVDLYELNEAFAAQSLAVNRELQIDLNKINVNGGAIAIGHPIGASGARVLVTLIYALKRTGGKKGVASLCIGGGMGVAMAIELLDN
jgi:acetyl-CoA C-acetyltransferase